jgi:hypothetical protein
MRRSKERSSCRLSCEEGGRDSARQYLMLSNPKQPVKDTPMIGKTPVPFLSFREAGQSNSSRRE